MKKAFNYMFKDNLFGQKALTYFIFAFAGTFLLNIGNSLQTTKLVMFSFIFLTLGSIIMFIPCGYVINSIKALIEQNENFVLPRFSYKRNFITGFKLMVAIVILSLVCGIGLAILSIITAVISALLSAKIVAYIGISLLFIAVILLILYYTIALNRIFATTEAWASFLQFKKATELIKRAPGTYNKGVGLFVLVNLLSGIISGILLILFGRGLFGIAAATLVSVIISTYVVFVNIYLVAKSIKD